jgi:hypothetical protein
LAEVLEPGVHVVTPAAKGSSQRYYYGFGQPSAPNLHVVPGGCMAWLFTIPVVALVVFLAVGTMTGRVKVKSCCAVADPRSDARLRAAFATPMNEFRT